MRLGLIARADRSGLSVQTHEFYRHMQPERVLVIDVGHMANSTTHCNKQTDLSKYPNPIVCRGWLPDRQQLKSFLAGLDVVFSAETFYSPELAQLAHRYRVKTVLQPNAEFLNRRDMPDVWAPPTRWMWDTIPKPKVLLPVPIATDRFPSSAPSSGTGANHFLHIVGRPAIHDRNGTADLLKALQYVTAEVTVTIKCQDAGYVGGLMRDVRTPSNVTLRLDSTDVPNYWNNYEGDVLLMPRRFGGLCLPVNEALGAGMPCVMPDLSPNNDWLPSEWLVPATPQGVFMCKQKVTYYSVDHQALAAQIDRFATDTGFYIKAVEKAAELREQNSWTALKPKYLEVLNG